MSSTAELKARVLRAQGKREALAASISEGERRKASLQELLIVREQVQALVQEAGRETQEGLRFHMQDLVQSALDAVFPGKYAFRVEFETKRSQTEVALFLDKDGERIDPMDSAGGGVVDIVAFALRLVAWSLSRTDNVIVLDEPFKWVSAGLRPLCGELMRGLCVRLGVQVLMVTHDPEMVRVADRVFAVDQKDGKSFIAVHEGEPWD